MSSMGLSPDSPIVFRNVETREFGLTDVEITGSRITSIGQGSSQGIDCHGAALLPGLADHHVHLAAMAAHAASVSVEGRSLTIALDRAGIGADGWVRAVGYHEGTHGSVDRTTLDAIRSDVPVRLQHRSGALWVLNSAALRLVGATAAAEPGVERDAVGSPTGRIWRADSWLRSQRGPEPGPDLRAVSHRLASMGITHLTDASPDSASATAAAEGVVDGSVVQHVQLCAEELPTLAHPRLHLGPVKIVAADHCLPHFDDLAARIQRAHEADRSVAIHCVTRASLVLTLAALDLVGTRDGDRIEHAAVAGTSEAAMMARLGIRVVTQPSLVAKRGDDYASDVEAEDVPDLWPYASLLRAGVRVAPSSDAPYGDPDPWGTIRAARSRHTTSGRTLGAHECVSAQSVLDGLLSPLNDPGGRPRRLEVGGAADLALLHTPLTEASSSSVRATFVAGVLVAGEI
jgi:predicted amidohydrolase YtcJ